MNYDYKTKIKEEKIMKKGICRTCHRIIPNIPDNKISTARCVICRSKIQILKSNILAVSTGSELPELTSSKVDEMIKKELKQLMETEGEVFGWIRRFVTTAWLEVEYKRIENFEALLVNMEGFINEPLMPVTYAFPRVKAPHKEEYEQDVGRKIPFDEWIEISEKFHQRTVYPPEVNRQQFVTSMQQTITMYAKKARQLLDLVEDNWKALHIDKVKNPNTFLDLITKKFDKYWDYLLYLRTAYVNIFNVLIKFDMFSTIIKAITTTIYEDLYQIDLQFWYRDEIFGYKNVIKLLAGEL
jgi:hypothetical protein